MAPHKDITVVEAAVAEHEMAKKVVKKVLDCAEQTARRRSGK